MPKEKLKTLGARMPVLGERLPVVEPGSWRSGLTSTERGYGYRWQQYRLGWLREHPLCGDRLNERSPEHSACVRDGRITPAGVVDHRVPHRGDERLFWDPTNHQSLCTTCHDSIKAKAERAQAKE